MSTLEEAQARILELEAQLAEQRFNPDGKPYFIADAVEAMCYRAADAGTQPWSAFPPDVKAKLRAHMQTCLMAALTKMKVATVPEIDVEALTLAADVATEANNFDLQARLRAMIPVNPAEVH